MQRVIAPMPFDILADIPDDIRERAARVKLVAFDVDGTLTDGRLWYAADGGEIKLFHAQDGLGIKRLHENGVEVAFITARISHALAQRANDLGISHLYQGQGKKRETLTELLDALSLDASQAAFVGDDLPDLAPMSMVGLAVAVGNAHPSIMEQAHWQTRKNGGEGAAREVCDLILAAQGKTASEREFWQ